MVAGVRLALWIVGAVLVAVGLWFTWLALEPLVSGIFSGDSARTEEGLAELWGRDAIVAFVLLVAGAIALAMGQTRGSTVVTVRTEPAELVKVRCAQCRSLQPEAQAHCGVCGAAL